MSKAFTRKTLFALIMMASSISGCSSMGVGEAEYRCAGIPDGVRCMSAQDAYTLTDGDDYKERVHVQAMQTKALIESGKMEEAAPGKLSIANSQVPARHEGPIPGVVPYPVKKVLPLRTPAKVMRVAFRAWESKEGALHVPGYVYTEIEPRRWMIGDREVDTSMRLTPLQVPDTKTGKPGPSQDGGIGIRESLDRSHFRTK